MINQSKGNGVQGSTSMLEKSVVPEDSVPKHSLSGMSKDSRRLLNTRGRRDSRGTKVFERAMNSMQILKIPHEFGWMPFSWCCLTTELCIRTSRQAKLMI